MDWALFYKILFFSGIFLVVISLFFPVAVFFTLISVGLILILFALAEQHLHHTKEHAAGVALPAQQIVKEKSIPHTISLPTSRHLSLFSFHHQKKSTETSLSSRSPSIDTSFLHPPEEKTPFEQTIAQKKPSDLNVIIKRKPELSGREEKIQLLREYLRTALKHKYPLDKIKEAGSKGNWPAAVFDKILDEEIKRRKFQHLGIIAGFFVFLVIAIILLAKSGLFILPYWVESLQSAPPTVLISALGVILLLIIIFTVKIMKMMKVKKIEYRVEEEKNVQEIQSKVFTPGDLSYETDLDKLYRILREKKKLTLSEVARGFNIDKSQAEEWGKILKEQNLIDIYYPAVGEAELVWKPSKSTQ